MKKLLSLTIAFAMYMGAMVGQSALKEKDVIGTWKLVIPELDETMNKYKQNSESEDKDEMGASERLEHAIEGAVGEFVGDLLGDMNIEFTFEKHNRAKLKVNVMGETEVENLNWHINSNGELVIDDNDHDGNPEVWMKKGKHLVPVKSRHEKNDDAYMIRVNR